MTMRFLLYDIATTVAAPFGAAALACSSKHRALVARFSPYVPALAGSPVWVHACSVGEVSVAKPVIEAMRNRWHDLPVLLTVSTVTGRKMADGFRKDIAVTWCPFDHLISVSRFLHRVSPRVLVLVETEVWPNLIRCTANRGIPVVIINGRISDKHLHRYKRFSKWLRPAFARISLACMQNAEYAERIIELGLPSERVCVTGNTKFDGVALSVDPSITEELRQTCEIPRDSKVVVFGSTRPGDEKLAAACWRILKDEFQDLYFVIVPRHLERMKEVLQEFSGEAVILWSDVRSGVRRTNERIIFVDVMGELVKFYALATVAVIGGSFFPGVNGHNPLESAALGIPTVFGPYMRNFIDPAEALVKHGGASQVSSAENLLPELRRLLTSSQERVLLGTRGREAVLANRGAIQRTLDRLAPFLEMI